MNKKIELFVSTSAETVIDSIRQLINASNSHEQRIAALEQNKNNDNDDLRRALIDADNALQRAINYFRATTEKNNHKNKAN